MSLIDEQYMRTPFYGVDKMTAWLRLQGHCVNPKRIRRLMRLMALEAVYPRRKRSLSLPDKEHKVYPYLLKDLAISRPDQVWAADITYIRMCRGWLYLMAIMDWFSRYVIAWELSVTLEADFCVEALKRALAAGQPEIFFYLVLLMSAYFIFRVTTAKCSFDERARHYLRIGTAGALGLGMSAILLFPFLWLAAILLF